jgi:hypothetical protein
MAAVKTAVPEDVIEVRNRGGAIFAGLALGLIGAAIAGNGYYGSGYYYPAYPIPTPIRPIPITAIPLTAIRIIADIGTATVAIGRTNPPDETAAPPRLRGRLSRMARRPLFSLAPLFVGRG